MAHAQFNIRISENFRSQLEAVAAARGQSQSSALHSIVAEAAHAVGWVGEPIQPRVPVKAKPKALAPEPVPVPRNGTTRQAPPPPKRFALPRRVQG